MAFQLVQIVGTPQESLLTVLQQELNQEALVQTVQSQNLEEAQESLPSLLPDMVVFFADSLDKAVLNPFCQEIRAQMTEHRPIIVICAAEQDKDQRIEYFLSGADDYLSTDLEPEELAVRLLVHLRRNVELLSNSQTRLPGIPLFARIIQRSLNLELPWAFLLIELNYFNEYMEVYGRIPSEQILKTLAALLKSVILSPDIVGQTDYENFMILTRPEKAEAIAEHLCTQFDDVVAHFYSEKDQKRGYIVSIVNDQISQRVPFVSLSIGVVTSENTAYKNHMMVFNNAAEMKALSKTQYTSSWASERMRLTGQISQEMHRQKKILIVESDAAMAFLLKSTLELQGYQTETANSYGEAKTYMTENTVDLLLADPNLHGEDQGWAFLDWVRHQNNYEHLQIICISSIHDREKALSSGASLYLPKPFELASLFTWVDRCLSQ